MNDRLLASATLGKGSSAEKGTDLRQSSFRAGHSYWESAPFGAPIISIFGAATGDEGKGRAILDISKQLQLVTGRSDPVGMVLKVNGGANSGHTAGGLKLNLIPAGVCDPETAYLALGRGVVADPRKLEWEIRPLQERRLKVRERLLIDTRTMVSDVTHRLLDLAGEYYRETISGVSRGSTGRGITPAYVDEAGQNQIFYRTFLGDKDSFVEAMFFRCERAVAMIRHVFKLPEADWPTLFAKLTAAELQTNEGNILAGYLDKSDFEFKRFAGKTPFTLDVHEIIEAYWEAGQRVRENIGDVSETIFRLKAEGRYTLAEHGQAVLLDKRHGRGCNVTASHTTTAEILQSAFIPTDVPIYTLGVVKTYDTKVGTHCFLTEMEGDHPLYARLRSIEFGTATNRQRMVGWFDAVEKAFVLRHNGCKGLMINKLDVLALDDNSSGELKICTAYKDAEGRIHTILPDTEEERSRMKPVYRTFASWREDISGVRRFEDLPENAKRYIGGMYRAMIEIAFPEGGTNDTLPKLAFIGVGAGQSEVIVDAPGPELLLAYGA
jgi:adenylosuccinate synthase